MHACRRRSTGSHDCARFGFRDSGAGCAADAPAAQMAEAFAANVMTRRASVERVGALEP
jgi:hypothetical protein